MKTPHFKIIKLIVPVFTLISLLSCSKDTDLLAEYIVSDIQQARFIGNLAISDNFVVTPQKSIVLDVLANDTFTDPDKVKIVETSQPTNGTVVINEDKTLTYYPDSADAPNSNTEEEVQESQPENNNSPTEENESTPEQNESSDSNSEIEETQQSQQVEEQEQEQTPQGVESDPAPNEGVVNQIPKENIPETDPKEEQNDQKPEEQEEEKTEDFTYSVETTDNEGNKTIQEAEVTVTTDMGTLKAFPGAEGYGKNTTGGRGGFVYHVTNLDNSGPGSLRHGITKIKGTRTIVFDVSGNINLRSPIKILSGYGNLTIAGQTAPGDGVTLKGGSLWIQDSNVIVRYIRIRPGGDYDPGHTDDALRIVAYNTKQIENVIIDHCSISWGHDEVIDISTSSNPSSYIRNLTIQNTIVSEAIDNEYGTLIDKNVENLTFYKNLYAHNRARNILFKNQLPNGLEFVNNVIYNFSRGTILFNETKVDIIGNVYLTNSNSDRKLQTIRLEKNDQPKSGTRLFVNDNTEDGNSISLSSSGENDLRPHLINSSLYDSGLIYLPNSQVLNAVLPKVGASVSRDSADERVVKDVINKTGKRIKHENEVGGYPILQVIARPYNYDKDKDGIADVWEVANNLNPADPNDGNLDSNKDGYTNLESFLYSLTQS